MMTPCLLANQFVMQLQQCFSSQAAPLVGTWHCCYVKEIQKKGARFGYGYTICFLRYDRVKPMHTRNRRARKQKRQGAVRVVYCGCCVHSDSRNQSGWHAFRFRDGLGVCAVCGQLPSLHSVLLFRHRAPPPAAISPPYVVGCGGDRRPVDWMTGGQAGSEH